MKKSGKLGLLAKGLSLVGFISLLIASRGDKKNQNPKG